MASDEPNLDNEDPNMAADFVVIERLEGLLARQRALSTSVRQLTETVEDLEKRTRAGVYAARLQEETWRVTGAFMCVCVPILVAYVFEYKTRDIWNTDIVAMRELYSGFMMSLSVFAALPFFICVVFEFLEFKCRLDQEFYPEQTAETFMTELGKSSGDEGDYIYCRPIYFMSFQTNRHCRSILHFYYDFNR